MKQNIDWNYFMRVKYINKESFDSLNKDNKELLKMLTAIIKSARESLKKLKIEVTN